MICFLVGNDFIPCLPCLDINEGAISDFFKIYKKLLPKLDGYIIENGKPNLYRLQQYFVELAEAEKAFLPNSFNDLTNEEDNETDQLRNMLYGYSEDKESNWKVVYYKKKFDKNTLNSSFISNITKGYVEALCWICDYYFRGCTSWNWFFNFHFAPLASDLLNISHFDIKFELSSPFLPLQQLLAVLPISSGDLLPDAYKNLIKYDLEMKEYFPETFIMDKNGKKTNGRQ